MNTTEQTRYVVDIDPRVKAKRGDSNDPANYQDRYTIRVAGDTEPVEYIALPYEPNRDDAATLAAHGWKLTTAPEYIASLNMSRARVERADTAPAVEQADALDRLAAEVSQANADADELLADIRAAAADLDELEADTAEWGAKVDALTAERASTAPVPGALVDPWTWLRRPAGGRIAE